MYMTEFMVLNSWIIKKDQTSVDVAGADWLYHKFYESSTFATITRE